MQNKTCLWTCLSICLLAVFLKPVSGAYATTVEPIKIGTIFSITGWGGIIGTPQKEFFAAMIDDVNAKGRINGRPLEFYYEDDKSIPTNAVIAATKLIKDRGVVAIVGTSISDSALAIVPICEQERVPFINSGPALIPFKKWVFSVGPGDTRVATHIAQFAVKDLGAKRIALLYSTDANGMLCQKAITVEIAKHSDVSIVAKESFEVADTNMIPQLTKAKKANPDLIILATNGNAGIPVAKNYKQLGITTPVLASGNITMPQFVNAAGNIAEESNWIFLSQPMLIVKKLPPDDAFRRNVYDPCTRIFQAKYGPAKEVTLFHASSYDAMAAIVQAMKIAGSNVDRDSIRDNLEKVNVDGFLGTFAPTPTDHQATQVDPMRPMVLKNGEWVPYRK